MRGLEPWWPLPSKGTPIKNRRSLDRRFLPIALNKKVLGRRVSPRPPRAQSADKQRLWRARNPRRAANKTQVDEHKNPRRGFRHSGKDCIVGGEGRVTGADGQIVMFKCDTARPEPNAGKTQWQVRQKKTAVRDPSLVEPSGSEKVAILLQNGQFKVKAIGAFEFAYLYQGVNQLLIAQIKYSRYCA